MSNKRKTSLLLVAVLAFLMIAGDHPLFEHWGDVASSNVGDFGSKWIHTSASGIRYALWGESASSDARAVFGRATSTSTSGLAIGVYGETSSPTGRGVTGYAPSMTGPNFGVVGATYSNDAQAAGVHGFNERPLTGSSRGVQGTVKSTYGYGVIGFLIPSGNGNGAGVYGRNVASSGTGAGVEGYNSSSNGWAGRFTSVSNGVTVSAAPGSVGLVVIGGTKNASVPTSEGDRLLYSEESTEVWFSDYGFGRLRDGFALVQIDAVFAETVNLDEDYHVFLQTYGDADLYVSSRTSKSFEVVARHGSIDQNAEFSYRLVGKRLSYEDHRLELAPWVTDEEPHYQLPLPPEPPMLSENRPEEGN